MRLVPPTRAARALYVLLLAGTSATCSDAGLTGPGRLAPTRVQLAFAAMLRTACRPDTDHVAGPPPQ